MPYGMSREGVIRRIALVKVRRIQRRHLSRGRFPCRWQVEGFLAMLPPILTSCRSPEQSCKAIEFPSDIDPRLAASSEEVANEALTPPSVNLGAHKLNSAGEPVSIAHNEWRLDIKLLGSGVRSFLEASCSSTTLSVQELVPLGFGPEARATFSRCRSIGPFRFSVSSFTAIGLDCSDDGTVRTCDDNVWAARATKPDPATEVLVLVDFIESDRGLSLHAPPPLLPTNGRAEFWLSTQRSSWMRRVIVLEDGYLEANLSLWHATEGRWHAEVDLMRIGAAAEAHGSVRVDADDDDLEYFGEVELDDCTIKVLSRRIERDGSGVTPLVRNAAIHSPGSIVHLNVLLFLEQRRAVHTTDYATKNLKSTSACAKHPLAAFEL
jgi:hypothetical protein